MSTKSKLELRISEIRTELRKIAETDDLTPELRESADALKTELGDCETRLQAAILAEDQKPDPEPGEMLDPEVRERLELRKKVTLTGYLLQAATGRQEPEYREYQAACEASSAEIPFDLLEPTEAEQRAVTPAPSSGTGVRLQRIVPAVFAMSAAPLLGIEMPRVGSGTASWLRITKNLSSGFQAKGGAQAATAGALTPVNTTPHRISARLEINAEAVAEVGIGTFESQLRGNLASVLSDALDKALLNGDGTGNNISGLITTKGAPTAETTTDTWTLARAKITDLTDGIFARSMADISLLLGVASMRKFDALFPATTAGVVPRESLSMNLKSLLMEYSSSANMPAAKSGVQTAVACRKGRPAEQLSVCPRWSEISITDVYSGAAKAETSYNLHVLIGDVLLLQPAAYETLSFKLA